MRAPKQVLYPFLTLTILVAATPVRAQSATPAKSDLSGDWQLDPAHSDSPPSPHDGEGAEGGGHGGGHGGWGGGGYGGHGGWGGGGHAGGYSGGHAERGGGGGSEGARPPRLPANIHITQTPMLVSFEDSTGTVLQEIATVSAAADTFARAPGALHRLGTWDGKSLAIEHDVPNAGKAVEAWAVNASGELMMTVKVSGADRPDRTFRRAYLRVVEP